MNYLQIKKIFETKWTLFINNKYKDKNNRLQQSIRYALQGEGKRIRPCLAMLCFQMTNKPPTNILSAGFAIEMIHTYSLVHDDLPLMDDDDMRRGRASVHKKFDEATALLAGSAILTDAITLLSDSNLQNKTNIINELSSACGSRGMIAGQMLDIHNSNKDITVEELKLMHRLKTGRLIEAACAIGGLCGLMEEDILNSLRQYGQLIGTVFQITDDLLDQSPNTGKTPGKDEAQNKNTYPKLIGKKASYKLADKYTKEAIAILEQYKNKYNVQPLQELSLQLIKRKF